MEKIVLDNPLMINGYEVKELTYDMNISVQEFMAADALSTTRRAAVSAGINPMVAAFDKGLHLYLGFAGIMHANPSYDISDLERVSGSDIMKIISVGLNFTTGSLERNATSDPKTSVPAADTTQADTTQA